MGRGRHDTLAPVDHPADARELAGRGSVSLVANPSSAEVVAVNDGEASTPNAGAACPEYTPTPLFAFDVQGARVTVWPAQSSGNARNRAGEGGEEDDSDDANRNTRDSNTRDSNTRDSHIGDSCGNDGIDCDNRIGDSSNCLNHIVYLHVYDGDGLDVLNECGNIGCPPFTLVAIKPACWNDDLTPWKCPGLFADDSPLRDAPKTSFAYWKKKSFPRSNGNAANPTVPASAAPSRATRLQVFSPPGQHSTRRPSPASQALRARFGIPISRTLPPRRHSPAQSTARISRLAARKRRPRADFCATLQRERTRS